MLRWPGPSLLDIETDSIWDSFGNLSYSGSDDQLKTPSHSPIEIDADNFLCTDSFLNTSFSTSSADAVDPNSVLDLTEYLTGEPQMPQNNVADIFSTASENNECPQNNFVPDVFSSEFIDSINFERCADYNYTSRDLLCKHGYSQDFCNSCMTESIKGEVINDCMWNTGSSHGPPKPERKICTSNSPVPDYLNPTRTHLDSTSSRSSEFSDPLGSLSEELFHKLPDSDDALSSTSFHLETPAESPDNKVLVASAKFYLETLTPAESPDHDVLAYTNFHLETPAESPDNKVLASPNFYLETLTPAESPDHDVLAYTNFHLETPAESPDHDVLASTSYHLETPAESDNETEEQRIKTAVALDHSYHMHPNSSIYDSSDSTCLKKFNKGKHIAESEEEIDVVNVNGQNGDDQSTTSSWAKFTPFPNTMPAAQPAKRGRKPNSARRKPGRPPKNFITFAKNMPMDFQGFPPSSKPTLYLDPQKRFQHNSMERERRIYLRKCLNDVRLCVPDLRDQPRASKVVILTSAIDLISSLEESDAKLLKELEVLKRHGNVLKAKREKLKLELSIGFHL